MAQIRAGVQEPSLLAAKRYVANLQNEYTSVQNAKHPTNLFDHLDHRARRAAGVDTDRVNDAAGGDGRFDAHGHRNDRPGTDGTDTH